MIDAGRPALADSVRVSDGAAQRVAWLAPVFFLSGVAALVYQVAWERVLYAIFGINIESVTIVVTAFLLGLGLGSLYGGSVSTRGAHECLRRFGILELAIGAFGACSIAFYHAVGRLTLALAPWSTELVTFVLVLAPTILMGATLPLLVTYAVAISRNVGWSVGTLYCVNTAGSAVAACLTVAVLLPRAGLQGSVWVGAACNVLVGVTVLARAGRERRRPSIEGST
jgi:predicted membrane-bound spermidine synthase